MKNINITNIIALLLGIGLFAYTFTRAITVPMTIDESSSFFNYVELRTNWQIMFDMACFDTANNHVLNTYCARLGYSLFGMHELSVRWGSLFAHFIYLFYTWQLSKCLLANRWLAVALFVAVNVNPYLLDFFSLERGYAWSIACVAASLYYFYEKNAWKSALFIALGVLANLTMLNYLASFFVVYNLALLLEKNTFQDFFKKNIPNLLCFSVLALLFYRPIKELKEHGEFLYGNDSLLEVFRSIWKNTCYSADYLGWDGPAAVAIVYGLLFAISPLLAFFQYRKTNDTRRFLLVLFPLVAVIMMILQYHLAGSKYLINRTALILFPLLLFSLLSWLDFTNKKIAVFWAIVIAGFALFHFKETGNLKLAREWWFDAHNQEMVDYLEAKAQSENKRYTLNVSRVFIPSVNFCVQKNPNTRLNIPMFEPQLPTDTTFDYLFIFGEEAQKINPAYQLEKKFGSFLLMRK